MAELELLSWIKPRDAIKDYAYFNGGSVNCRAVLAEHLRDGDLRARARHTWTTEERSAERAWDKEPERDAYRPVTFVGEHQVLDKHVWRSSQSWAKDLSTWRWKSGRFRVTSQKKPTREYTMLRGVEFCQSDVIRILVTETVDRVPTRGRPPELKRWESFWMIVLDLAMGRNGGFDQFTSQNRMADWVLTKMELPSSGDLFERTVKKVWRRYELGKAHTRA